MCIGNANDRSRTSNGGQGKDGSNDNLRPHSHLQVPNDETREDSECPVGSRDQYTSSVGASHDDVRREASIRAWVLVPEVRYRSALEHGNEEIHGSKETSADHDKPDDPDVNWFDCHAQQEDTDGDLQHAGAEDIENLAEIPESECYRVVFARHVPDMFTGSMSQPSHLTGDIYGEEELGDGSLATQ